MYVEITSFTTRDPVKCTVVFHEGILHHKTFTGINIRLLLALLKDQKLPIKFNMSEYKKLLRQQDFGGISRAETEFLQELSKLK